MTLTVTDDKGVSDSCTATITVYDGPDTPPLITCPADVVLEPGTLSCEVVYHGPMASATDACDPNPVVTSDPPLPATFATIGDHVVTFTATDACGNESTCQMIITVAPTAYCLKREAIDALEVLLAVDTDDADLIDAIGYLHMSLGEDDSRAGMSGSEVVWGDPNRVDGCHGGYKGVDVFQYEQASCDKLQAYLENGENTGFGFGTAIEAVREALAEADKLLAATAIADAIANSGDPGEIAVALDLKAQGDTATAQGGCAICDEALDKYEEAWEKAVQSWCNN